MLRRSHTAVLEKNATFTESFCTEPYEVAWAGEARWFIRILDVAGESVQLDAAVQISPDGLHWCDEGSRFVSILEPGLYSLAVMEFGHWMRLACRLKGDQPCIKVLIYLALKE
ncbi:MAG: hypothetical protein QF437_31700 [Planctomycetota bacterium]|jgi:hypothetical protein|nr:hypothetical protein [Planctomycetota bacterium]MDP7135105.1 hypothetical protein [Planctomycetota bacterium]MDP7248914.1 hypothetical protein [Planctomycetota bacterium]